MYGLWGEWWAGTNLGNIIVRRVGEPLEMLPNAIIVFFK